MINDLMIVVSNDDTKKIVQFTTPQETQAGKVENIKNATSATMGGNPKVPVVENTGLKFSTPGIGPIAAGSTENPAASQKKSSSSSGDSSPTANGHSGRAGTSKIATPTSETSLASNDGPQTLLGSLTATALGVMEKTKITPEQQEQVIDQIKNFLANSKISTSQLATKALVGVNNLAINKDLSTADRAKLFASVFAAKELPHSNPLALLGGTSSIMHAIGTADISPENKPVIDLLASLDGKTEADKANFNKTAEALVELSKNTSADKESKFIGIAKDAIQKLPITEQQKILSNLLANNSHFSDPALRNAFSSVLANLPDGKSAENLVKGISDIQNNKTTNKDTKDAQSLALLSNQLTEAREADLNPETKNRDINSMTQLIESSGLDYEKAKIAAKVLEHIDPNKKADAIQLALSIAKEANPIQALSLDAETLARNSNLGIDQVKDARKNIIEAGLDLIQETAKSQGKELDKDTIKGLLGEGPQTLKGSDSEFNEKDLNERIAPKLTQNILDNPKTTEEYNLRNQANYQKEAIHQATIKAGALDRTGGWFPRAINRWQPGQRGLIKGGMTDAYYATQDQANATMRSQVLDEAKEQLNQAFPVDKRQAINDLSKLLEVSGIKAEKPITDLRSDTLRNFETLTSVSQSLTAEIDPFRVSQNYTASDKTNGKFELFTDKASNEEFYRLTAKDGTERYAIKSGKDAAGKDTWKFLQGSNFRFNDQSYADTINSFKQSQLLANQPQVLEKRDPAQDNKDFKYYETQNGTIAVYRGEQTQYQNLIYKKDTSGDYQRLDPQEAQAYQKAVTSWGYEPNKVTNPDDGQGFKIYTNNAGKEIAVGIRTDADGKPSTIGLTYVFDETLNKWTQYHE